MILSGKAKLAGIFGWPVEHSLSPRLHGFWIKHYRINGAYVPLAVMPKNLASAVRMLPKIGFVGANVTAPHKETVIEALDEVELTARRIGAVNTIVVQKDGSLLGCNTDGFGFLENLKENHQNFSAATGPAVVIGAGGAARAIIASLIDAGAPKIRLVNRTPKRAKALAADIGGPISVHTWANRNAALKDAALLVNTTTLGMTNHPPLDLDISNLPIKALVTDIVYVPLETPLLSAARVRGNPVVGGLGMLLHQARPGFFAWFGRKPEVTPELRAFVVESLGP